MQSFLRTALTTVKDLHEKLDQSFDDALRREDGGYIPPPTVAAATPPSVIDEDREPQQDLAVSSEPEAPEVQAAGLTSLQEVVRIPADQVQSDVESLPQEEGREFASELKTAQARLRECEAELAQWQEEGHSLARKLGVAEEKLRHAKAQLRECEAEKGRRLADASDEKATAIETAERLAALEESVLSLEAQLISSEEQRGELFEKYQRETALLRAELQDAKMAAMKSVVGPLNQQLAVAQDQCRTLKSEVDSLWLKISEKENAAIREKNELQQRVGEMRSQLTEKENTFRQRVGELERIIERKDLELTDFKNVNAELKEIIRNLEIEISRPKEQPELSRFSAVLFNQCPTPDKISNSGGARPPSGSSKHEEMTPPSSFSSSSVSSQMKRKNFAAPPWPKQILKLRSDLERLSIENRSLADECISLATELQTLRWSASQHSFHMLLVVNDVSIRDITKSTK